MIFNRVLFLIMGSMFVLSGCSDKYSDSTNVIELWSSVKAPEAPKLESLKVNPEKTALLILDIEERTTNMKRRPRAVASVPVISTLMKRAREKNMLVAYSTTSKGTPETILTEVKPEENELVVKASVNKFYNTALGALLEKNKIDTVIVTGTAAEGAVVNTATAAAVMGYSVIVPVDCMASSSLYAEQYVVWHLLNAPAVRNKVKISKSDMIKF